MLCPGTGEAQELLAFLLVAVVDPPMRECLGCFLWGPRIAQALLFGLLKTQQYQWPKGQIVYWKYRIPFLPFPSSEEGSLSPEVSCE